MFKIAILWKWRSQKYLCAEFSRFFIGMETHREGFFFFISFLVTTDCKQNEIKNCTARVPPA